MARSEEVRMGVVRREGKGKGGGVVMRPGEILNQTSRCFGKIFSAL